MLDQTRSQGVAFDIAAYLEEMVVLLDWKGLEPALIQVTCTNIVIMGVPTLRVRQGQPMAKSGQLAIASRPKHQMSMVGQQAISQQSHPWNVLEGFAQNPLKGGVVTVFLKDRQASVGAIENMINVVAPSMAQWSSHDR